MYLLAVSLGGALVGLVVDIVRLLKGERMGRIVLRRRMKVNISIKQLQLCRERKREDKHERSCELRQEIN